MKIISRFQKSLYFIILYAAFQLVDSPLTGAEIDGFWKFTNESIQKIAKYIKESNGETQDAEDSIESYRNHVREFQLTGTNRIKIRLIQYKKLGDRYPKFIRDFDLTYTEKEGGTFLISNEKTDVFSVKISEETMYLDDIASGNRLEMKRLSKDEITYTGEKVYLPSKLDRKPKVIKLTEPIYPPRLKNGRFQGIVELKFMVNPDGTTSEIQVVSSPHAEFSKSAIEAILTSTFRPGKVDGRAVRTYVKIPITFR